MSELNDNYTGPLELHAGDLSNREVIELPTFDERLIITRPDVYDQYPAARRPIPVSTVEWRSTHLNQFTPITGLDFLLGVEQLNIQQTVELHDMLSQVESENRYVVKVPQGETLYLAHETSSQWQRTCLGSGRAFILNLYDATQQQAMQIIRRLACSNVLFGCYPEELTVVVPPGDTLGMVRQVWSVATIGFRVYDSTGDIIYQIECPSRCACTSYKDAYFTILSRDGSSQVGSISHQWDQLMVGYSLSVHFPSRGTSVQDKALLLAAAFLLEYMYFEKAKNSRTCCC